MKTFSAVTLGKLIALSTKTLKLGGGSAAPGLYALKVDSELVSKLSKNIKTNIIITGTNGKTTTSRMIAHFAKKSNSKVIRNHTGSNLERGIASALINGPRNADLGIWELDEAAFNTVALKLHPKIIVFLNVFRDQLDRYGEVNSVVKKWAETLAKLPEDTIILVNGDDENTLKLKDHFKGKVQTFGVDGFKISGESIGKRKQAKLDFEAKDIKTDGLNGSSFKLGNQTISLPLPGTYHIYDAVAALAVTSYLKLSNQDLTSFSPAFGRFEKLPFGAIFLIKNPVGATQVFETLSSQIKPQDRLLLALNDNLADGTDVSWIWDSNFEVLPKSKVIVSGTRAEDLAVRLKYADFDPKQITIIPSLEDALEEARLGLKGSLYILPTYTALMEIQAILTKLGIKENYWNES